jgi:hypothetical protein
MHPTQHFWQILLLTILHQNYHRKQTMLISTYISILLIFNPPDRTTDLPDCRRELVLRLLPMVVPSGMKTATRRAHITSNAPNTNGGPGTSCNIYIITLAENFQHFKQSYQALMIWIIQTTAYITDTIKSSSLHGIGNQSCSNFVHPSIGVLLVYAVESVPVFPSFMQHIFKIKVYKT